MRYERPVVVDLGSIAKHTWEAGASNNLKGGIPPDAHIDMHCEWSGGSGMDWPTCPTTAPLRGGGTASK